jgi:F0F1-type ATP synthase assembly protein I
MSEKNGNGLVFVARLGFELVVTTFLCAGIGYYFDSRLGMKIFPALSITGLVIGGGTGFWLVYRTVTRMTGPDDTPDEPDKGSQG